MVNIKKIIESLLSAKVDYVIVDNSAAFIHGWKKVTIKIDFCYSRSIENLKRIVKALSPYKPRPRDFPAELPFIFDETTLKNSTNFTFMVFENLIP